MDPIHTNHDDAAKTPGTAKTYAGACHCGAVRFEVTIDLGKGGSRCNCSICTKLGVTGGMVKPDALVVQSGAEDLGTYVWGAKISTRYFCKTCGVHCFGRGHLAELGGDYASVNLNTLEGVELVDLPLVYWDGRQDNWQAGPRKTPWPIVRAS